MEDCIFCQIARKQSPSWPVLEDAHTYAFLDINPATRYHTLIIPKQHYTNMFDVTPEVARQVITMVKKVMQLYQEKLRLSQAQVICSSGSEAQQDVFHLHYHVVPRSSTDGQNIRWSTHAAWREDFDDMLRKLR